MFDFEILRHSVWLDIENDQEAVPDFNGDIIMKVMRISWPRGEGEGVSVQMGTCSRQLNLIASMLFVFF